jgi:cytochrome P450
MARFSAGPAHQGRRDVLARLLPPVPLLDTLTGARVHDYLRHRTAPFDLMPMARQLPGEVLGQAMGLPAGQARRAAALTGRLCDQVLGPAAGREDADAAVTELLALLSGTGPAADDVAVATASILFQAREATAALIGLTLLAEPGQPRLAGHGEAPQAAGGRVEHVLRHDAPVQNTRRTAVGPAVIGDAVIPAGVPVWVFLSTAEQGTGSPATFGSGPHACPGVAQATAIARQVAAVLDLEGWRLAPGQRIDFEPRPNLRLPRRLLVSRA